jgi:hypothetical protein
LLFISLLSKNIWQIKLWRSTLRQFFVFTYQERQREMARRRLGNLKCIALKGANSIPIARAGEIRQLKF